MSQIAIKDLKKSGKWVTERVSLDDERKLFIVCSGTGEVLKNIRPTGKLMTLREAIEAARSAQQKRSLLAITIPFCKNDYYCFYFASLRELRLIEEQGGIFIQHWQ